MSDIQEQDATDEEFSEIDETTETLDANLQLIIGINSEPQETIQYLQNLNNELCKMVNDVLNIKFIVNKKVDDIHYISYETQHLSLLLLLPTCQET